MTTKTKNEIVEMFYEAAPKGTAAKFKNNPEMGIAVAKGFACYLAKETGDKYFALMMAIAILVTAGVGMQTAYDGILGKGQYDLLVADIYAKARNA
jgi:hypothetical protein